MKKTITLSQPNAIIGYGIKSFNDMIEHLKYKNRKVIGAVYVQWEIEEIEEIEDEV